MITVSNIHLLLDRTVQYRTESVQLDYTCIVNDDSSLMIHHWQCKYIIYCIIRDHHRFTGQWFDMNQWWFINGHNNSANNVGQKLYKFYNTQKWERVRGCRFNPLDWCIPSRERRSIGEHQGPNLGSALEQQSWIRSLLVRLWPLRFYSATSVCVWTNSGPIWEKYSIEYTTW